MKSDDKEWRNEKGLLFSKMKSGALFPKVTQEAN
jgi:hypothetical protein